MKTKFKVKRIVAALLAVMMTVSMMEYVPDTSMAVKAAGEFPTSGVHKGTLSHGSYRHLSGLKASIGASVIEADTMTSSGAGRACFCLSPGVSETTKVNAYTSANYTSGYGIRYYKSLITFYYDCKDDYKTDAVRFATQIFVWRTVVLERNHKGNFAASAYDGSGFKSGFIASIKNLMGYSENTAAKLYDKAYGYIKDGANGTYNNKVSLLKWTATASQTMLTGKVYSDKQIKIKINKDLSESGTGISLAGTKYELHEGTKKGTKVGTFTLNKNGIDTITLKKDGTYDKTVKYYLSETKNTAGTVSNKDKDPVEFSIDWSKIKDGGNGGTVTLNKEGIDGTRPGWFKKVSDNLEALYKDILVNNVPHIRITVKKIETGTNKPLTGGEFTIYAYNAKTGKYDTKVSAENNLGHQITNPMITGSNGTVTSEKIYYTSKNLGKFKITETKAPKDYINKGESKEFRIQSGNRVTQESQVLKLTFDDPTPEPNKFPVRLKKEDSESGTPIFDAGFTISVYKNKKNGHYYPFGNLPDAVQSDMEWTETVMIPQLKDTDGNLTNIYETKDLEPGRSYRIVENKRPVGYATNISGWNLGGGAADVLHHLSDMDKYGVNFITVFTLTKEGKIIIQNSYGQTLKTQNASEPIAVSNNQVNGSVIVKKQDSKTDRPLPGAAFELWEVTKEKYNTEGYLPEAGNGDTLTGSGETDENGEFVFGKFVDDNDGNGTVHIENGTVQAEHYYLLVETKAPEGYRLPENTVTKVYISADEASWVSSSFACAFEKTYTVKNEKATLDLNIHKVSVSRTGKESVALTGAEFALYKVEKIVTDNGALSDEQKELEDANDNGIDDDTETVIGEDTEITDKSDVGAFNDEGNSIDYSVLSNENYIDFDYSTITPLVDNITTDSKGNAVVSETLEEGAYVLVETKAPKNYLKADPQYIYIDSTTLYSTRAYEIEVKDEEFEALVKAVKTDEDTGKIIPQPGVGFKVKNLDTGKYVVQTVDIYKEPEVEGAPHELIKSEETDTFYTDETGTVTLPNVLSVGHYQLEEVISPKGYVLNNVPIEFTIDDEIDYYPDDPNKQFDYDENTRDVVIMLTYKDKPTETYLIKKDISTGEEISGGTYRVEDKEGNVIDKWTGTGEAHKITGLIQGETYLFIEEIAPDGYTIAEEVEFTVNEDGNPTYVEMKDDYIKLELSKQDIITGKELPGAYLELYNDKNELVDAWVSTTTPHRMNRIKKGTYKLVEKQAPKGFVVAASITFTVEEKSEVQKIVMKDDYASALTIRKKDSDGKLLSGAKFRLKGEDGSVLFGVTDKKGECTFGKDDEGNNTLKPQKYVLTEEKTKEGYSLLAEPVEIELPVKLTRGEAINRSADISKAKWDEKNNVYRFYTVTCDINNDTVFTLPQTGANNNLYAILAGILIFILGISLYFIRRKKKVK